MHMPLSKSFKHLARSILVVSLFTGLVACHDEAEPANLQVIHLSPDAPNIEVRDDGFLLTDNLAYSSLTNVVDLGAGTHDVQVLAVLPNDSRTSAFTLNNLDFAENTDTIVVAVNEYASLEPYVFVRDGETIDADMSRVRIAHLAHDAPMVDIYVTEPDADLVNETAITTLQFRAPAFVTSLAAGDYQIRITPAGNQDVLFTSDTITLGGGRDLTVLATKNTGIGDSPVELLAVREAGSGLLRDTGTPTIARWVHLLPNTGNIDVALDDGFEPPTVADLSYGNVSETISLDSGSYNVKAVDTATTTPVLVELDSVFGTGLVHTQYLLDSPEADPDPDPDVDDFQVLTTQRDQRRVATTVRLDIVHAAFAAGTVDVYLNTAGTDITDLTPTLNDVPFDIATNFVNYAPGSYDLVITDEEDQTEVLLEANNIALEAGGLYTVAVIDQIRTDADPDGLPIELLLLDDFVTP